MKICAVEGCDRPARALGWCGPHRYRFLRHGDPLAGRSRDVIRKMLEALELTKLERPVFTALIGYRTKAIITDPSALPEPVSGAELSNPAPVLTIRSA